MINRTLPAPLRRDIFDPRSSSATNPLARGRPLSDRRSTRS
jgi:hypothetical protein